jgi:hypothetical protein
MAEPSAVSQGDDDGASEMQEEGSKSYLTPLQKSLLFELTTRRKRIASARSRADFWLKDQTQRDHLDPDVIDEEALDALILERKKELTRLKEARQIKWTIVEAADATHALNASMAAHRPAIYANEIVNRPASRQSLRYLAAERDELALEYLRTDAQIKAIRIQRGEMAQKIDATRKQTSTLIEQVRQRAEDLQQAQRTELQSTARRDEKSRSLKEALQAARGKREMVKGVLRVRTFVK